MKAVMYHYVRREDPDSPHFRYLHADDFIRQLDWFSEHDRLMTLSEFTGILAGDIPVPEDGVVLTFDDGFIDHYEVVFPELARRGVFGIFYVPAYSYTHKPDLLDVHKIHCLTGRIAAHRLLEQLQDMVSENMLTDQHVQAFREQTYRKHDDQESVKLFKRTFNYFIDTAARTRVLDALLSRNAIKPDAAKVYMSKEQLKALTDGGMLVGSHSVTHPVFSRISVAEQAKEIKESFDFIEQAAGRQPVKTFCYPYGGFHSFTPETERLLSDHGVRFSFNVESRDIAGHDLFQRPQALPRYDCNEFPFGKAR